MSGDGYQDLANAIIIQAAKDYRRYKKCITRCPADEWAAGQIRELEQFFMSPWCDMLSNVDGSYILKKLKEEE